MRITNPNNLPRSLVDAVTPDQTRGLDPARMSVTDLINPPMMRVLRHKYWNDMEERVDDRVWLMLGTAFHYWIDSQTGKNSEIVVEKKAGDYTIVGVMDLVEDSIITDYKVTSAFSFLLGDKEEWNQQLNCYAWLARSVGHDIKGLQIIAILRDWVETKTYKDPNYPKSAIFVKPVVLWSQDACDRYIKTRLNAHRMVKGAVAKCTEAEKWHKPTTWAVKSPDVQKAKRVLGSREGAEEWAAKNMKTKFIIEERPGEDSRCRRYCSVRKFCPDNIYKGEKEDVGEDET